MRDPRRPSTGEIQFLRRDYSISDTGIHEAALRRCCVVYDLEAALMFLIIILIWGGIIAAVWIAWAQVPA